MIRVEDRARLLALARAALEAQVRGDHAPAVPADLNLAASGVFVTIHCRGDLRGCLGTLDGRERLADAIRRLAADVCRHDYRFAPIRKGELNFLTIDLSVLTPPARVANPLDIVVGRDGLIIEKGSRRGLLLPQVAPEHGWERETFLAQTCIKAGLPPDAWQRDAVIYRFEAEVFGESKT